MKALFKLKVAFFLVVAGLSLSCKSNGSAPADNYGAETDSSQVTADSISPAMDTTNINSSTTGTTGATGQGSTGSGSAGTTEKGNSNMRTDSTSTP